MLLTVDVGNTNIAMGLVQNDEVIGGFRLMTQTPRTSDEYVTFIHSFLESMNTKKEDIEDALLSSVVPKINYTLASAIIKAVGKTPIIIDANTPTGIKIEIDHPNEVGADLLVDLAGAYHRYQRSCLVLDFGTATTFTYVSNDGVFRCANICPGLGIFANVLTSNTAKLPEIEIAKPKSILATNTIDAMQAGVVYGYIGLVEKIVTSMKKELQDPDCPVIATGGLGKVISSETDVIDEYDPDLAYKGMNIIYKKIKGNE